MNKIEIDNALFALVRQCNDEMIKAGKRNDEAHKAILDRYEAKIKPLKVSRITFMVLIGRANNILKDWGEV